MDFNAILLQLAILIIAARVAAELSERFGLPAVVLEILTGVLIGPSVLGLVGTGDVLEFFGEVGAILLLLEVGMQMNLADLARVGGSALRVAAIGIVVPMGLGFVLLSALGLDSLVALFLAAGITATSVGITARVFGDLRILASPEARTVLGAAVADDVGGLMILTVVVGIASTGGISVGSVASTVGAGVGFVFVAAIVCVLAVPLILRVASQQSRTEGTLMAAGLAVGLLVARFAAAARLAPIVGSFIAGLGISESELAGDVKRRLAPIGHLFIPVFFLQIGIKTDLASLGRPEVLGIAAALAAVAVAGKLVAGLGVGRGAGSRLLVGISMIPRGEVGLIFASLGLSQAVLDAENYAVLVMVVLFTTLVPPPWIRHQVNKARRRAIATRSVVTEPPGGWLIDSGKRVELAAEPSEMAAPLIALEAAIKCASREPGRRLVEWLGSLSPDRVTWDDSLRRLLFQLLKRGNARSWRFIEVTGLGSVLMPTIVEAMMRRRRDPFDLDPSGYLRWGVLENLNRMVAGGVELEDLVWEGLEHQDLVRLAAIVREAFEGEKQAASLTSDFARSIGLNSGEEDYLAFLVAERHLLAAAARRLETPTEDAMFELAVQLGSKQRAGGLYVLALAEGGMQVWERERLHEMMRMVDQAFLHPELTGPDASALIAQRKDQVVQALTNFGPDQVRKHLDGAPRRYLLDNNSGSIARHIKMTHTLPNRFEVRLEAEPEAGGWLVHVAAQDRPGLLACIAKAMLEHRVAIGQAAVSTWDSGLAIDVFTVSAPRGIDWEQVRAGVAAQLTNPSGNGQMAAPVDAVLRIDNLSSAWHTILEVEALDREGLLYRIASALSRAGIQIHSASLSTVGEVAVDIFHLSVPGGDGGKLDEKSELLLRAALAGRSVGRWSRVVEAAKSKVRA